MLAVMCKEWCQPSGLVVEDVPVPTPGPGQVRIRARAASVNFADTLIIQGKYQVRPDRPFSPGLEAAGEIDALGDGVAGLHVGDRVAVVASYGGFAQYAVVDAERVFPIPAAMSFEVAAAFPVAYGTSHLGLCHRAGLRKGEVLLVHGAAGGVGLTAVEIGRHLGATVIATASSQAKLQLAAAHGADAGIDYTHEDIRERVKALTDGRGADVVYDPVGGDVFDASLRCINWEGRLLVVGFAAGRIPQVPANHLLVKNCAAIGVFWGAYLDKDPGTVRAGMAELFDWYERGALKPHISMQFSLHEAAKAMAALLERRSTGKVVITIE